MAKKPYKYTEPTPEAPNNNSRRKETITAEVKGAELFEILENKYEVELQELYKTVDKHKVVANWTLYLLLLNMNEQR